MASRRELWVQMAALTMEKCLQKCHRMGSCCDTAYCEMAVRIADEKGELIPVNDKPGSFQDGAGETIPFLDFAGRCVVPPHLRPLCTLHQCDINGLGFCPEDPEWTKKYFDLRERLEEVEDESLDDLRA